MARHLVFVYGTLKRGEPNHNVLTDSGNGISEYVGLATTSQMWPLVIASKWNIPYLLHRPDFGKKVLGEIYSVDDRMLDLLECHPTYYTRLETRVVLEDGSELFPWMYFVMDFRPNLLDLETFDNYSSYGKHGLRYVESESSSSTQDMND